MPEGRLSWEAAVDWLKNQPWSAELVSACYFDNPPEDACERFRASEEWKATRELLPNPPGRAIDFAAGRGISSYALAKDGWTVTALEPNPSASVGHQAIEALSRALGLSIQTVSGRGEDLPFGDETVDLFYCRQGLHHAADLDKTCREAVRVLKPGGVFLATREHVISKPEDLEKFFAVHPLHHLYGGENAFLIERYEAALKQAGLRDLRSMSPSSTPINLFPSSFEKEKQKISELMGVPLELVPDWILQYKDLLDQSPGRLYSFWGLK